MKDLLSNIPSSTSSLPHECEYQSHAMNCFSVSNTKKKVPLPDIVTLETDKGGV